jgi:hypothetical protein
VQKKLFFVKILLDRKFIFLPLARSRIQEATVTPQKSINFSIIQNVQTNSSTIHNVQLAIKDTSLPNINISHVENCTKIPHVSKRNVKLILKIFSDLEPLRGSSNKKTLYSTRSCVIWAFFGTCGPLKITHELVK